MRFLTSHDIKNALRSDARFRDLFPEFQSDIQEFIHNPSCPCTAPLVDKIFKCPDRLKEYFPNKIVQEPQIIPKYDEMWHVINCSIDELDEKLRRLPIGRKQLSMARYEDQITVVINMFVENTKL